MEDSATSSTQSSWKGARWVMWAFIILVSADSLMMVFSKWRTYDYLTRAEAVIFAWVLLAFPMALMRGFRRGKHMPTEQIVWFAYIILLLFTILVNVPRHMM